MINNQKRRSSDVDEVGFPARKVSRVSSANNILPFRATELEEDDMYRSEAEFSISLKDLSPRPQYRTVRQGNEAKDPVPPFLATDLEEDDMYRSEAYLFGSVKEHPLGRQSRSMRQDNKFKNPPAYSPEQDHGLQPIPVDEEELFCICLQPEGGRSMIECANGNHCLMTWFHLDCIGMNEDDIPGEGGELSSFV